MPKGDRGERKYKPAPEVDWSVEADFDEKTGKMVDWSTGTVHVGFKQDDGSVRGYDYEVPAYVLRNAADKKSTDSIADYVATQIVNSWAVSTGVGIGSKQYQAQIENALYYLKLGLDESVLKQLEAPEIPSEEAELPESIERHIVGDIYPRIRRESDDYDRMFEIAGEVQREFTRAGVEAPSRDDIIRDALGI